ncbi:hypothetical protein OOZ51_13780 [Arthrobacter sp. MI7-26]|uniref:hypothetical protein n=1 Tax=Arthrobacter sp. MI7-26 TaxID=2993653 RepID=UPI0022492183|nr:hypothetical protein [Arthrobacter sp. MI7-26]MCX2748874.1 hypothetical protein [Arthrobacter sp. MI7-26]
MDFSLMMACAVIKSINHEALSALPNAPVIAPRPAGGARRRLVRLRALLARLLHQAAWAIEPHFAKHQGSPELS